MKPGSFNTLVLTAEFGTLLVNFLRQLHKVNFTFHLQELSAEWKGDFSSHKNFHFFKNNKKIHVLKIISIMQLQC